MRMKSKDLRELTGVMNTSDVNKRDVVTLAIAYAVVTNEGIIDCDNEFVSIKEITETVCELAILDRVMVEKKIKDMYEYFNLSKNTKNTSMLNPTSFEEALYFNRYFGGNEIENVNTHLELFKTIVRIFFRTKEEIFDKKF